jgi:Suppressor of fused protein (SUFU)
MADFWAETYERHFQRNFQKPFDIQVYHDADGAALKLATYDLARPGFRVYASLGLADKLTPGEDEEVGEVILFCDAPDAIVPRIFINSLFFILQQHIPLASPFAIGFGDVNHPFYRRYRKTALYFTQPGDPDSFDEVQNGEVVGRVFQAFFITPEEDAFLDEHGAETFEKEFRKQFGGKLTEEERAELLVHQKNSPALQARMHELHQQANQALSVRRPSCVSDFIAPRIQRPPEENPDTGVKE